MFQQVNSFHPLLRKVAIVESTGERQSARWRAFLLPCWLRRRTPALLWQFRKVSVSNPCWPSRQWSFAMGCSSGLFFASRRSLLRFLSRSPASAEPGDEPCQWSSSSPAHGSLPAFPSRSLSVFVAQQGSQGYTAMHWGDR